MPADDLSGFIATPQNTPPATRSDLDRREAMLVDTFKANPEQAQVMLDRRNQMQDAQEGYAGEDGWGGDTAPLPPTGTPAPVEPAVVASARSQLQRVPGGEALLQEWGQDFGTNLSHANAGLARLRQSMPALSDIIDRLPPAMQNSLAPEILRYAATFNLRYANFTGERVTYPSPARAPSASPSYGGGAPGLRTDASLEIAIEQATAEMVGHHQRGQRLEAAQAEQRLQGLIARRPRARGVQEQTGARAFGRGV